MATESTGEHMIRAFTEVDLGDHIHAAAIGPVEAFHLEEAAVAFGHDMFMLGRAWERGEAIIDGGHKYLQGFLDAIEVTNEGES